ncbi:Tail Fiber protein [Enterobacter cloacae]|uniref:phage tail protein n=1 Tax=Enterobacter cloacae TaxID=550 RepID=UPI0007986A52|nr:phage tail protein [Enterobacter cloacae]SAD46283.1 Tail Fiber protein [Enterobacter cloacae]
MAEKYYSILTNRGKELEAQSSATGKPVIIKDFVVGDGNGQPVKPDPAQTKLVREVYRNAISALQVSPDQANQFIAQLVLATGVGGFVVREVGLLTDAGELYSVANCAAIEKPENGVSVKLQYRLAVSETASIELKVATGDGLFLRQDANLSDVKDAVQSRKSLGLKGAAVLDVGKVVNTVAAGDDSRIVNALQKNNNLSDLTDKVLARANLQLKTAAVADVQTSKDDITAGRLLVNGSAVAIRSVRAQSGATGSDVADANNLPKNSVSFVYSNAENSPGITGSLLDFCGLNSSYNVQIAASYTGDGKNIRFRTYNGDAAKSWNPWYDIYHSGNKPTSGDVDAVSASQGGTFQKSIIVKGNGASVTLQPLGAEQASYLLGKGYNGGNTWYVGRGGANNNVSLYNYIGLNGVVLSEDGAIAINPAQGKSLRLGTVGSAILNIGDSDSGLRNSVDGQIDLLANSKVMGYWNTTIFSFTGQMIPTNYANFDSRYYTKSQSDAGYMPKAGAYTKAESDGRFQPKGSYGAPDTSGISGNILWWKNTATGVITMMGQTAGVANSGRVTFPFAFPTKCFGVIPTRNNSSGQGAAMQPYDVNTTGWNLRIAGGGTETVMWVAMGK